MLCVFGGLSGNSILFVGAGALFAVAVIMPFAMQALQKSKAEKRVRANANFLKTQQFFCFDENSVTLKLKAGDREEDCRDLRAERFVLCIYRKDAGPDRSEREFGRRICG